MRPRTVGRLGGHVFLRPPGSHFGRLGRVGVSSILSLGGCGVHVPNTRKIVCWGGCGGRGRLGRSWLLGSLSVQSGRERYSGNSREKERAKAIPHSETLPWSMDCVARNLAAIMPNLLVPATHRKFFPVAQHNFLN